MVAVGGGLRAAKVMIVTIPAPRTRNAAVKPSRLQVGRANTSPGPDSGAGFQKTARNSTIVMAAAAVARAHVLSHRAPAEERRRNPNPHADSASHSTASGTATAISATIAPSSESKKSSGTTPSVAGLKTSTGWVHQDWNTRTLIAAPATAHKNVSSTHARLSVPLLPDR